MDEQGYDEDRFTSVVPRDLICVICLRVLRKPRLCEDGEHAFCFSCISEHLDGSHTCPQCRKDLTPETLVRPQSYLRKSLGELRIKCDYIQRGCFDQIQLENLQDHVKLCGFAPVPCENCKWEINKKDKAYHEKSSCQFGAAKCQDCEEMKKNQDEMKKNQDEMKQEMCQLNEKLTRANTLLLQNVNENADNQKMHKYLGDNLHDSKRKHDQMEENLKSTIESLKESKRERSQLEENLKSSNESLNESKKKYHELEENLRSTNESLNESKRKRNQLENDARDMKQQIELLTKKSKQVADQPLSNFSSSNKEIIIMGGLDDNGAKKSVIIFNPGNGTYAELPPMNTPRAGASSCVYNSDVIVAGSWDGTHNLDSIEILRINQRLPRWTISNGRLPTQLMDHVLKVYQEKLLVIGGFDNTGKVSNEIHELALDKPYTPTLLTTMPEPRMNHAAEIVNDKLFILGGRTKNDNGDDVSHDSVMVYDFITKEFKTCRSLPKPVHLTSTVTWGKQIIVIGGVNERGNFDDVIMHDIKSGHCEKLPPLRHRRSNPLSVIIEDVIFVFGGFIAEQGSLTSVECYTIGSDGWKELPGMKENRLLATVVVKP